MYNFIKFTKTSSKTDDRISITRSNSFGFPRDFCNNQLKAKPSYVVLFYDQEKKAVAFYFTNDEQEKHKFKVAYSKQGYGANVAATSFFKVNNLNSKQYRGKYEWKTTKIEGVGMVYVIDILQQQHDEPARDS